MAIKYVADSYKFFSCNVRKERREITRLSVQVLRTGWRLEGLLWCCLVNKFMCIPRGKKWLIKVQSIEHFKHTGWSKSSPRFFNILWLIFIPRLIFMEHDIHFLRWTRRGRGKWSCSSSGPLLDRSLMVHGLKPAISGISAYDRNCASVVPILPFVILIFVLIFKDHTRWYGREALISWTDNLENEEGLLCHALSADAARSNVAETTHVRIVSLPKPNAPSVSTAMSLGQLHWPHR